MGIGFFFSSRRRHTRLTCDWEFRRVLFRSGSGARAQKDAGAIEIMARITPTGARPEPVRQFTFYILTKSYSEIVKRSEERRVGKSVDIGGCRRIKKEIILYIIGIHTIVCK